jgi:GNAT superfamily N-acetyltransferase|tara:strand:+ start:3419 stop:3871 length:453 start_codon:yes stop_codon:yes gene_type:complete
MTIEYHVNRATEIQIEKHLKLCEANFKPPLSERVELQGYSKKIADKAVRFEAWEENVLIALIASYCNDNENRSAFITSVSVLKEMQGKGLAKKLMKQCIKHIKALGLEQVILEVGNENANAIAFYGKHNFMVSRIEDKTSFMKLNLLKGI